MKFPGVKGELSAPLGSRSALRHLSLPDGGSALLLTCTGGSARTLPSHRASNASLKSLGHPPRWVPILRIWLSRAAPHGGAEGNGACSTPAASGSRAGGRGRRGHAARHMGLARRRPGAGCQVAMVTSRRDAAPINSQFEVILLKELFSLYLFLYIKSRGFFMFTFACFIVSL